MENEAHESTLVTLNQMLLVEYQLIGHYPELIKIISDEKLKSKLQSLVDDSMEHANTVSTLISKLGGKAKKPNVIPPLEPLGLIDLMNKQLELEKLAFRIYNKIAEELTDEFSNQLQQIAEEEQSHIKMVEDTISYLEQ